MRALVALAAVFATMTVWSGAEAAEAAEARITDFAFSCETPEGRKLKPKFGDVGGVFYTDLPAQRQQCLEAVKRKIALCRENTDFAANTRNEKYAECLPIFREQAKACVGHFERERVKCDGGGAESAGGAAPLEAFGPDWVIVENQPCQLWTRSAMSFTWSGACVDGKVSGEGRLAIFGDEGSYRGSYEGSMAAGKRHGHGTLTFVSGRRYEGEYRDGKRHGRGTYTESDGSARTCEWRDSESVSRTCDYH